jgi:hypothetical protein
MSLPLNGDAFSCPKTTGSDVQIDERHPVRNEQTICQSYFLVCFLSRYLLLILPPRARPGEIFRTLHPDNGEVLKTEQISSPGSTQVF